MTALDGPMAEVLREQQAYYRAYASTYVGWIERYVAPVYAETVGALAALPVRGDVLELGAGTGQFTAALSELADSVTALDGADEALAFLAKRELPNVELLRADVFAWSPPRRWDVMFMSNFLAHVPPALLADFVGLWDRALVPRGKVIVFDVTPAEEFTETAAWEDGGVPLVARRAQGQTFEVVKKFWEPDELLSALQALGWSGTATLLGEKQGRGFVLYTLTREGER